MTAKTIQLSTRVTDEDAEFLARLQLEGAQTPSDKIRALIGDARRRFDGVRDYRSSLKRVAELLAPALQELQAAEHEAERHSELVRLFTEWLGEATAFVMSELPDGSAEAPGTGKLLEHLERGLADRAFTFIESVLRLGVTEQAPCYDKRVVSQRLGPSLDLLEVIRAARGRPGGTGGKSRGES